MVSIDGSVEQSSFGLLGGRLALLQAHLHPLESAPLHLGVDDPGVGREGVGNLLGVLGVFVVFQGRDGRATELAHVFRRFFHHDFLCFFRFFENLIIHGNLALDSL